jgi:ElaB/YqjD/DUF883 family membrane-anchored ribosome-binding protein
MKNLPKSLFILALISMTVSTASAIDNFFVYEVDEIEEAINTNCPETTPNNKSCAAVLETLAASLDELVLSRGLRADSASDSLKALISSRHEALVNFSGEAVPHDSDEFLVANFEELGLWLEDNAIPKPFEDKTLGGVTSELFVCNLDDWFKIGFNVKADLKDAKTFGEVDVEDLLSKASKAFSINCKSGSAGETIPEKQVEKIEKKIEAVAEKKQEAETFSSCLGDFQQASQETKERANTLIGSTDDPKLKKELNKDVTGLSKLEKKVDKNEKKISKLNSQSDKLTDKLSELLTGSLSISVSKSQKKKVQRLFKKLKKLPQRSAKILRLSKRLFKMADSRKNKLIQRIENLNTIPEPTPTPFPC